MIDSFGFLCDSLESRIPDISQPHLSCRFGSRRIVFCLCIFTRQHIIPGVGSWHARYLLVRVRTSGATGSSTLPKTSLMSVMYNNVQSDNWFILGGLSCTIILLQKYYNTVTKLFTTLRYHDQTHPTHRRSCKHSCGRICLFTDAPISTLGMLPVRFVKMMPLSSMMITNSCPCFLIILPVCFV